ncbi:MAG TPA: CBS domain-containing protein [Candidatus Sulfotelmatobacter sp.]|nr:CBS domain-containing protein [Candidatus Sulfotelmatobacter sp.]
MRMELISTHINADFDALASMVAAAKLYPKARLLFPGSQERNVREFLRGTRFPLRTERLRGFPFHEVGCLVLVDVKRAGRIGPLAELVGRPGLDVHIYDHHPAHPKDIPAALEILREVGATTTILVDLLREQGLPLTPLEATLLATGIYEETGLLTFSNTTERDLQAAAFCLSRGANLTQVADSIRRELTAEQIGLLNELVRSAETHLIHGIRVVISTASLDRYVGDLAVLAHKLRDMENLNVLFTLVRMDNRVHVVARSRLEAVDVGRVVEAFGGGGHATAASATVKDLTLHQVKDRLLSLLRESVRPLRRAQDIMTTPVKAIPERFTIRGAAELMNRFSLAHLPVMRRGELVGLLSREVVDKAVFHGLGDAPVREYMSGEFPRVAPEAPLGEVQQLMVERNLGLLPVVEGQRLRGAVTREDLLRWSYEHLLKRPTFTSSDEREPGEAPAKNVATLLSSCLPPRTLGLLKLAGQVGDQLGTKVYAVGGFVRDLLLRHENQDVDLVVEGDGIAFAEALAAHLTAKVTSHRKFGTAVLTLADGFKLDVATARTEYYEAPAALPTVEHGSIKLDLYRRDFTVNTLAVCLNPGRFGELLDFFGGQQDLRDKALRINHNLSFVEDPTRILRAARFEVRFGLRLARHAEQLIANAVQMGLLDKVAGYRLFSELTLVLEEARPLPILQRLEELGVLKAIHPRLVLGPETARRIQRAGEVLTWYEMLYLETRPLVWLVHLLVILEEHSTAEGRAIIRRLSPPARTGAVLRQALVDVRGLARAFQRSRELSPSQVYCLLAGERLEILLAVMARVELPALRKAVGNFITQSRRVRPLLRGDDLRALGLRPGPIYRDILNTLLYARLDGEVQSRDDELRLLRRRFSRAFPPEREPDRDRAPAKG